MFQKNIMDGTDDLDDINSDGGYGDGSDADIIDPMHVSPRINRRISAHSLNRDEPKPDIQPSRELRERLRDIDRKAGGQKRIPMTARRTVSSIRIVPDSHRSNRSSAAESSMRSLGARSYQPDRQEPSRRESPSERAYHIRQKFIRLANEHPQIELPDTRDPDALERMYKDAIRTVHYKSTSATWIIYMGAGYGALWYGLNKMGMELPAEFVAIQIEMMSHYPHLLKALGDPGGISLGSSWPSWLKLLIIIVIHTMMFVIIYKISGNINAAHTAQRMIAGSGFMGGRAQANEATVDMATGNLGGLGGIFDNLGNLLSGGGAGGIIGNVMNMLGGSNPMDDIDVENPPPPVMSDDSSRAGPSGRFSSTRESRFD